MEFGDITNLNPMAKVRMPRYALLAPILALLGYLYAATVPSYGQVPPPESVLGFKVGEDRKLADWAQVVHYFQMLAAAVPQRVRISEVGKSTLGKPFVLVTISSADNIRHLDRYLQIQQRLADPRGLSAQDAEKLIAQGRTVVLITCTVHSDEVASTQTSLEFVYKLLSQDTPRNRNILDNNIFL